MAIQADIPLQVKSPAPIQGPLDTFEKVTALKDMMQQGRLRQQETRRNQLLNEDLERAQAGKKAYDEVLHKNIQLGQDGTFHIDNDAIENELNSRGFPEQATAHAQQRQAVAKATQDELESELKTRSDMHKQLGNDIGAIAVAAPEQQPALYSGFVKQSRTQKAAQMLGIQLPPQWDQNTAALAQQISDSSSGDPYGQYLKRVKEKREADASAVKLPGEQADANIKQQEDESMLLGNVHSQADWNSALSKITDAKRRVLYPSEWSEDARKNALMKGVKPDVLAQISKVTNRFELAQKAATDPDAKKALDFIDKSDIDLETAKEKAKALAPFQAVSDLTKGGGTTATGQPTSLSRNEDYLNSLNSGFRNTVKAIADGRQTVPSGMAIRSPYWQAVLQAVHEYDPMFDQTNYNNRAKLRGGFTSGKQADNLTNLNTALEHAGRTADNIEGLGNYDGIPLLNSTANTVKNWLKESSGAGGKVSAFRNDVQALVSEATRAWRGVGGNEADLAKWRESLSTSDSPTALKESLKELTELLMSKARELHGQYINGMNLNASDIPILSPRAKQVLKKIGVDDIEGTDVPVAPKGSGGSPQKILTEEHVLKILADPDNKGFTRKDAIDAAEQAGWTVPKGMKRE